MMNFYKPTDCEEVHLTAWVTKRVEGKRRAKTFSFSSLHSTHTLLSINGGRKQIVVASDSYDESHLILIYIRESRAKSTKKKGLLLLYMSCTVYY